VTCINEKVHDRHCCIENGKLGLGKVDTLINSRIYHRWQNQCLYICVPPQFAKRHILSGFDQVASKPGDQEPVCMAALLYIVMSNKSLDFVTQRDSGLIFGRPVLLLNNHMHFFQQYIQRTVNSRARCWA
jgi:hypothetical protein